MGSTPSLLYIILCVVFEARVINLCDRDIATPFGLCNAPAMFQRCMLSIFSDMVECFLEIFMDDFSVFGDSFDDCLTNLEKGFEQV